jgi:hypothetical protein
MRPPSSPPRSPQEGNRRGRRHCKSSNDSSSGGLVTALLVSAGLFAVAGVSALVGWYAARETAEETAKYYTLPARDGSAGGGGLSTNANNPCSEEEGDKAGPKCVVCLERPQRFAFVQCGHICLCEPCLEHMARDYEKSTLWGSFSGPVRMPCPVCRQLGYVMKTYTA